MVTQGMVGGKAMWNSDRGVCVQLRRHVTSIRPDVTP